MEPNETVLTEWEVRLLRDVVFGRASTEKNWQACREHWLRPEAVAWLQARSERRLK